MKTIDLWPYLWKTPIFGLALVIGVVTGDFLASQLGLEAPPSMSVFPFYLLALYLLAISPLLLTSLLFFCRLITGGFLTHWLLLAVMTWIVYSVSTRVSGAAPDTFLGLSSYKVLVFLFASLVGVGAAVLMFPDHYNRRSTLLPGR